MSLKLALPSKPATFQLYWNAPIFAAVLSAITLTTSHLVKPHSYEVAFPAFFSFLPMAFYFGRWPRSKVKRKFRLFSSGSSS